MTTSEGGAARKRFVVGVDGSAASLEALRWAVDEAAAHGAELEVVAAWQLPATAWSVPLPEDELREAFQQTADKAIAEAAAQNPDVPTTLRVAHGGAAEVLLEAAKGADLLVVGSRGHGGFTGALLGSVGQHVVQHAPCPVVIIR